MKIQTTKGQGALISDLQHGDVFQVGPSFNKHKPELLFDINNLNPEILEKIKSKNTTEYIERDIKRWKNYFEQEYFQKLNIKPDAYLFATADATFKLTAGLLDINPERKPDEGLRDMLYILGPVELSKTKGNAMCTEASAVGQYILQHQLKKQYESQFASGEYFGEEEEGHHAFIPIYDLEKNIQYIFDIARPEQGMIPRIVKLNEKFDAKYFDENPNKMMTGKSEVSRSVDGYSL